MATNAEWLVDVRWLVAAPLLNVVAPPTLLLQGDGKALVVVAAVGDAKALRLVVRRYAPDTGVQERSVALPAPLAGNPIIVKGMLVLPLANGLLHRLPLVEGKALEEGPTWRAARSDPAAKCWLVPHQENDFFATDGNRTLQRWYWPHDQDVFEPRGN